jgi:hypothetical protein
MIGLQQTIPERLFSKGGEGIEVICPVVEKKETVEMAFVLYYYIKEYYFGSPNFISECGRLR